MFSKKLKKKHAPNESCPFLGQTRGPRDLYRFSLCSISQQPIKLSLIFKVFLIHKRSSYCLLPINTLLVADILRKDKSALSVQTSNLKKGTHLRPFFKSLKKTMIQFNCADEMASICHAMSEFCFIEKIECLSCFFTVLWPFLRVLIFLDHPV